MTPDPILLQKLEDIRKSPPPDFPLPDIKLNLDEYQRKAVAFLYSISRGILADEAGLGKSLMALGLFSLLRTLGEAKTCAVVCPSTAVLGTWRKEIVGNTSFNPIILLGETSKGPAARSRAYAEVGGRNSILVTNYEIFRRDSQHPFYGAVDLLIFDESSFFKNYHSETAKAVRHVCSKVPRVVLCNATPVEISVMDIYSQVEVLYPGMLGRIKEYRERYCVEVMEKIERYDRSTGRMLSMLIPKIVGYQNIQELKARVDWLILRRTPADVGIKYAEVVVQNIELPYSLKLYEVYKDLQSGIVRQLSHIRNVAFGVKFNYMLMACISPCLVTKKPYEPGESPKFDALLIIGEKLKERGERLVVFSRFRQSLMVLEQVMLDKGFRVGTITGRESKQQRLVNQDKLNAGQLDVLLINMAGARSLNLQTARFIIFIDSTFNPSTNKQVIYRLVRRTQLSAKVFVYIFTIRKSVEQRVLKVLEGRSDMFDELVSSKSLSVEEMRRVFAEDLEDSKARAVGVREKNA